MNHQSRSQETASRFRREDSRSLALHASGLRFVKSKLGILAEVSGTNEC
jgi:hypothetical protein